MPQQHTRAYLNVWGKLGLIKLASMSWRTHTMCVMPCVSRIGSWMKTEGVKKQNKMSYRTLLRLHWWNAVKPLPCFSLQQSRDLKTDLVISPENETKWCVQALQINVSAFSQFTYGMFKNNETFFLQFYPLYVNTSSKFYLRKLFDLGFKIKFSLTS